MSATGCNHQHSQHMRIQYNVGTVYQNWTYASNIVHKDQNSHLRRKNSISICSENLCSCDFPQNFDFKLHILVQQVNHQNHQIIKHRATWRFINITKSVPFGQFSCWKKCSKAKFLIWRHTTNSALHRETRKTYVVRLQFYTEPCITFGLNMARFVTK